MEGSGLSTPAISAEPSEGLSLVTAVDPSLEEINAVLLKLRLSALVEERLFRERHTLRTAVETHAAHNRLLQTKWQTCNIELNRAVRNLSTLSSDHDRVVASYKKKCAQAESVALLLQDNQLRLKSVMGERDKLKDDLKQLNSSKLDVDRQLHDQKKLTQTAQSLSNDLAKSLEQSKSEHSKVEAQFESLKHGIQTLLDETIVLIPFDEKPSATAPAEQLDLLKKSYVKWKAKHDEAVDRYRSSCEAHNKERTELLHDVIMLQKHVVQLKEECMQFSKERARHLVILRSFEVAQDSLKLLSAKHTVLLQNHEEVIKAKKNSDETHKNAASNLNSRIEKLEKESNSWKSRFEAAEKSHAESLQDKIDEVGKKNKQIDVLQAQYSSLQDKLYGIEREKVKETDGLRAECKALQVQNKENEEKKEKEIKMLWAECKSLQGKVESIEKDRDWQINTLRTECKALQNEGRQNEKQKDEEINSMKAECKFLQDKAARVEVEKDEKVGEFKALQDKVREIEDKKSEENHMLRAECKFLRVETSRIEQRRNEETSRLHVECRSLQEKLQLVEEEKEKEIEALRAQCLRWQQGIEDVLTTTTDIANPSNDDMPISVDKLYPKTSVLISPAPLDGRSTQGETPESRSRYTDYLPFPVDNCNGVENFYAESDEQRGITKSSDTDKVTESCDINQQASSEEVLKNGAAPTFGDERLDIGLIDLVAESESPSLREREEQRLVVADDCDSDAPLARLVGKARQPSLKQSDRPNEVIIPRRKGRTVSLNQSRDEINTEFGPIASTANISLAERRKSRHAKSKDEKKVKRPIDRLRKSGSSKTIAPKSVSAMSSLAHNFNTNDNNSIEKEIGNEQVRIPTSDFTTIMGDPDRTSDESGMKGGSRKGLRPRKMISYNYDEEGRDIVEESEQGRAMWRRAVRPTGLKREMGYMIQHDSEGWNRPVNTSRRTEPRRFSDYGVVKRGEKARKRRKTISIEKRKRRESR